MLKIKYFEVYKHFFEERIKFIQYRNILRSIIYHEKPIAARGIISLQGLSSRIIFRPVKSLERKFDSSQPLRISSGIGKPLIRNLPARFTSTLANAFAKLLTVENKCFVFPKDWDCFKSSIKSASLAKQSMYPFPLRYVAYEERFRSRFWDRSKNFSIVLKY
ncbi:hypothetical protein AVEN_210594-1 [Araneus ventricosus]|uniref:Uncharacterized protein n=1 Tax=Araneus ventricosus TaxID=182803 RepID=A0A4Y2RHR5_ARAVE|nr:hypothetical protein AVEN_210594-1 [Araneus ventricosus]